MRNLSHSLEEAELKCQNEGLKYHINLSVKGKYGAYQFMKKESAKKRMVWVEKWLADNTELAELFESTKSFFITESVMNGLKDWMRVPSEKQIATIRKHKYDTEHAEEIRASEIAEAHHFGEIGVKYKNVKVTYQFSFKFESQFGIGYISSFKTEDGATLKWFNIPTDCRKGDTMIVNFTVKSHGEYNEIKETVVLRMKVVENLRNSDNWVYDMEKAIKEYYTSKEYDKVIAESMNGADQERYLEQIGMQNTLQNIWNDKVAPYMTHPKFEDIHERIKKEENSRIYKIYEE